MNSVDLLKKFKNYCRRYYEENGSIIITNGESTLRIYLPENPGENSYVLFDLIEGSTRTSAYTSDISELIDLCIEIFGEDAVISNKETYCFKL